MFWWKLHRLRSEREDRFFTSCLETRGFSHLKRAPTISAHAAVQETAWKRRRKRPPYYSHIVGAASSSLFRFFVNPPHHHHHHAPQIVFILFPLHVFDHNVLTSAGTSSLTPSNPCTCSSRLPINEHTHFSAEKKKKLAALTTNHCTLGVFLLLLLVASSAMENPRSWIRFAYSSSPIFKGLR